MYHIAVNYRLSQINTWSSLVAGGLAALQCQFSNKPWVSNRRLMPVVIVSTILRLELCHKWQTQKHPMTFLKLKAVKYVCQRKL